jgi:hypothetical protein
MNMTADSARLAPVRRPARRLRLPNLLELAAFACFLFVVSAAQSQPALDD